MEMKIIFDERKKVEEGADRRQPVRKFHSLPLFCRLNKPVAFEWKQTKNRKHRDKSSKEEHDEINLGMAAMLQGKRTFSKQVNTEQHHNALWLLADDDAFVATHSLTFGYVTEMKKK
jgi:hypothetical protein